MKRGRVFIIVGAIATSAGCLADTGEYGEASQEVTSCAPYAATVYTPYVGTGSLIGTVAAYPWRGPAAVYPGGDEAFNGYGASLPATVECGYDKGARAYLDVTAGCLSAIATSTGTRGQIALTADGSYRSFAKGFTAGGTAPVKWTDTGTKYSFYYASPPIAAGVNPGFKAFVRYRTEEDLYVASWRADGVVQIQRKQCGVYTALAMRRDLAPPSAKAWHSIRFEAVGDALSLWLDGSLAMTVTDTAFSWGTAGIRVDSFDAAYIDNWKVYAP